MIESFYKFDVEKKTLFLEKARYNVLCLNAL